MPSGVEANSSGVRGASSRPPDPISSMIEIFERRGAAVQCFRDSRGPRYRLRSLTVELQLLGSEFAARNVLHATDALALIALLDRARAGEVAAAGWLAGYLGLNSASTTALVDRFGRARPGVPGARREGPPPGHPARHRGCAGHGVGFLRPHHRARARRRRGLLRGRTRHRPGLPGSGDRSRRGVAQTLTPRREHRLGWPFVASGVPFDASAWNRLGVEGHMATL